MEHVGKVADSVYSTIHAPAYNGGGGIGSPYTISTDFAAAFHTYAVDWSQTRMTFSVDGAAFFTLNKADVEAQHGPWVYDHPFYLILNNAIGGDWPGPPDATTVLPQHMLIDYVRVYRSTVVSRQEESVLPHTNPGRATVPTVYRRTAATKRYLRTHRTRVAVIAGSVALVTAAAVTAMATADAATQDTTPVGAIKASSFASQSGAQVENTMDAGGGQNVGWLSSGDWMRYNGVDLGSAGTLTTSMRVAAAYAARPGTVEVHLDSLTGQLVATIPITYTGGWQDWATRTDAQPSPGGKHDVYLVMHSDQSMDFANVNWFAFNTTTASGSPSASASAMPSMSTPATTAGGWVPIDKAKWQAQLAEFNALVPRSVTTTRHNPEFNAT